MIPYVAFVLSSFVPHLSFFWCLGKVFFVIVAYFTVFTYVLTFHANRLLRRQTKETICMKCESLYPGNNKTNFIKLSSAESAQRSVKVNKDKKVY